MAHMPNFLPVTVKPGASTDDLTLLMHLNVRGEKVPIPLNFEPEAWTAV
jgi:hypothetical protein